MISIPEDTAFTIARRKMVQDQLRRRGVHDERVLEAMERIPRHIFADEHYQPLAYDDHPVPIAGGQTISQPFMVALMLQALRIAVDCRVLEIGTGTGYQAALLGELAGHVVSIERIDELAIRARKNLTTLGIENVEVIHGDGTLGYSTSAPYDRIIVAAAASTVPRELLDQLGDGGILLIPVGSSDFQTVRRITKTDGRFKTESLDACRFVPLIGGLSER